MKVVIYGTHQFEKPYLTQANAGKHELKFVSANLDTDTTLLASGAECVALFSSDTASAKVLRDLHQLGVRYVALRSAGYNHVDLKAAAALQMKVACVPRYSPYAIAEHTVALMLALNRKLIRANNRVKELNFSLDGLIGFDMNGKTVGIVGLGNIGRVLAKILHGFGCQLLGFDLDEDPSLTRDYGLQYTSIDDLCAKSDIVTLQLPLNEHTKYLINRERLSQMKDGVMLINTSRGGLIDTKAVIDAMKSGKIGYLGLDVYEEEKGLFFEDHSEDILQDDVIARLLTFRNALITSHQAFLTSNALENIADTTIENIDSWQAGLESENELTNRPV